MLLRNRAIGSKANGPSSSIVPEGVSPCGKQPRKRTFSPVKNIMRDAEKCQRKVKLSAAATTTNRPAAATTTNRLAAETSVDRRLATTTTDRPTATTTADHPAAVTTTDRAVATTVTSHLTNQITAISGAAAKIRRRPYVDHRVKNNNVDTYPPPYPIVPPHGWDPSWRRVPLEPAVEAYRTGTNTVIVTWDDSVFVRGSVSFSLAPQSIADISFYELYVCQETEAPPDRDMWHLTGPNLPVLKLPVKCELERLPAGHRYHFAVRAVDVHDRRGPFGVAKVQL